MVIATAKPIVTIYALDISGQVFKKEGRLDGHGRRDRVAQHRDVPYVRFTVAGERGRYTLDRGENYHRYLLILEGTGHPDPFFLMADPPNKDSYLGVFRDYRLLKPWDDTIDAHIARNRVTVVADYRDVIRDPLIRRAILESEHRHGRDRPDLAD